MSSSMVLSILRAVLFSTFQIFLKVSAVRWRANASKTSLENERTVRTFLRAGEENDLSKSIRGNVLPSFLRHRRSGNGPNHCAEMCCDSERRTGTSGGEVT